MASSQFHIGNETEKAFDSVPDPPCLRCSFVRTSLVDCGSDCDSGGGTCVLQTPREAEWVETGIG